MKKTLSFILLFIFSLASSQSKDKESVANMPLVSLNQIFTILKEKQMDDQIKRAIPSDLVVLSSNNKKQLEMYLKFNKTFLGKKIILSNVEEKNTSFISLNYNYSQNTLEIEIQKRQNGKKMDSKTMSYNYYTYK